MARKVAFGKAALGFAGFAGALLGGRMPPAAQTRPWHARRPGPYATGSKSGEKRIIKPAGRGPLFRLAGNRAKTPGALGNAASESTPPRPHAELDLGWGRD